MRVKELFLAGLAIFAASTMTEAGPDRGGVTGKIIYKGTPAKQKTIDMSAVPSCAKQYPTPPTTDTVVTGPNNTLENVVVYISAGAPDDAAPNQPAILDQRGCRYSPHVLAFQVGQELKIINDDQTAHNVHTVAKVNKEWNKIQLSGTTAIKETYDKPEFIRVQCDVHPWMHGALAVLKNSHFSVSGQDGSFTLPNLPPGKYTVRAWHELYGELSQEVTVTGPETKTLDFVFTAKPY